MPTDLTMKRSCTGERMCAENNNYILYNAQFSSTLTLLRLERLSRSWDPLWYATLYCICPSQRPPGKHRHNMLWRKVSEQGHNSVPGVLFLLAQYITRYWHNHATISAREMSTGAAPETHLPRMSGALRRLVQQLYAPFALTSPSPIRLQDALPSPD